MKVAIDSGPLESGHAVRGVGVNTKELIDSVEKEVKRVGNKKIKVEAVNFTSKDLSKFDLLHYTSFHPYFPCKIDKKTDNKVLLTIHDLIYLIYPDKYPPGIKGTYNFLKNRYELRKVDMVLTISETSKKDIVRFLGIPAEKVKVIYLAAKNIFKPITNKKSLDSIKKKYKLPDKFILYVGDANYNKNLPTLIKASSFCKLPLVIVGKNAAEIDDLADLKNMSGPRDYLRYILGQPHPETAHYRQLLTLFNKHKIIRPGFVSDEDLVKIYNLASVYVQPSYYEGFGLPVLEAMACGAPVIISKTNALVEVAGDAALIFDPDDHNDLVKKIKQVVRKNTVTSTAKELKEKGLKRAKQFSWKKTAKLTLQLYKDI